MEKPMFYMYAELPPGRCYHLSLSYQADLLADATLGSHYMENWMWVQHY